MVAFVLGKYSIQHRRNRSVTSLRVTVTCCLPDPYVPLQLLLKHHCFLVLQKLHRWWQAVPWGEADCSTDLTWTPRAAVTLLVFTAYVQQTDATFDNECLHSSWIGLFRLKPEMYVCFLWNTRSTDVRGKCDAITRIICQLMKCCKKTKNKTKPKQNKTKNELNMLSSRWHIVCKIQGFYFFYFFFGGLFYFLINKTYIKTT